MKKGFLLATTLFTIATGPDAFSQTADSIPTRPFQLTFIYPLGTNGADATDYSNKLSFNMLVGVNGGVQGAEIGGLVNYNAGDVKGFQMAGISNVNARETEGFQMAGIANIDIGETKGFQLAGVSNMNFENAKGFRLSTTNFAFKNFSGFQFGVFNFASALDGVQFGVVNFAGDAEKGLPLGIINIVPNGHFELETTAGEAIYTNFDYKMGVRAFHTIFKTGLTRFNGKSVVSYGLGFGGIIPLAEDRSLAIAASSSRLNYDGNWNGETMNSLYKLDLNYHHELLKGLTLVAGPSVNFYISEQMVDGKFGTLNVPYAIYENETKTQKQSLWVGANAGISYIF